MSHDADTVELVWSFYTVFEDEHYEAKVRRYLRSDVRWHVAGANPLAGDFVGVDAVLAAMRSFAEHSHYTLRLDTKTVFADRAHAVAIHWASAQRPGIEYAAHEIDVFHVEDGRISEFWSFSEDQTATRHSLVVIAFSFLGFGTPPAIPRTSGSCLHLSRGMQVGVARPRTGVAPVGGASALPCLADGARAELVTLGTSGASEGTTFMHGSFGSGPSISGVANSQNEEGPWRPYDERVWPGRACLSCELGRRRDEHCRRGHREPESGADHSSLRRWKGPPVRRHPGAPGLPGWLLRGTGANQSVPKKKVLVEPPVIFGPVIAKDTVPNEFGS